jgi:hypothetical protein
MMFGRRRTEPWQDRAHVGDLRERNGIVQRADQRDFRRAGRASGGTAVTEAANSPSWSGDSFITPSSLASATGRSR